MANPTISRVIFLTDLGPLLLDLVMMDMVDLVRMISNWEVAIKITQDTGGRHYSE